LFVRTPSQKRGWGTVRTKRDGMTREEGSMVTRGAMQIDRLEQVARRRIGEGTLRERRRRHTHGFPIEIKNKEKLGEGTSAAI